MKRRILSICILIVFLLSFAVVGVCEHIHREISGGIVRLHIIANSDDERDQNIKLKVRDAIINSQKDIFPDGFSKKLQNEEKQKLTQTVMDTLSKNGVDYGAVLKTGQFYFPTKKYENITLPAGNYDAVRVILGEGKGQNWWCVMYPPLCFSESAVGKLDKNNLNKLKESMTEFEYDIISEESIKVVPAFKIVETWQIIKEKIRKSL